jgi:hypothetical protein
MRMRTRLRCPTSLREGGAEGAERKTVGSVVIRDPGRAHPRLAAERGEFGECLVEGARGWAARKEEVELLAAERSALGADKQALDRRRRRIPLDRELEQAPQHLLVLAGRSDPDPPSEPSPALDSECESQRNAAESAQDESFREPSEDVLKKEAERLDAVHRNFEVQALFEDRLRGFSEGRLFFLSPCAGDQPEQPGTQPGSEVAWGEPQ